MCRLIETMAMIDGEIRNVEFHQWRVNWTFEKLFPGLEPLDINSLFGDEDRAQNGLVKARFVYGPEVVEKSVKPHETKVNSSLKVVEANFDYSCKYENREVINELFAQRGDCDNILIVQNGSLTDTAYSNIALFDGENWVTPNIPLLRGTMREALLQSGMVTEKPVSLDELQQYQTVRMINALIPFEEQMDISVSNIF